jgi:hypothetical protein
LLQATKIKIFLFNELNNNTAPIFFAEHQHQPKTRTKPYWKKNTSLGVLMLMFCKDARCDGGAAFTRR